VRKKNKLPKSTKTHSTGTSGGFSSHPVVWWLCERNQLQFCSERELVGMDEDGLLSNGGEREELVPCTGAPELVEVSVCRPTDGLHPWKGFLCHSRRRWLYK